MQNKKSITIPKSTTHISYNINKSIPILKIKHNDYETIRDMVTGEENTSNDITNKINLKNNDTYIYKNIKNFKIV